MINIVDAYFPVYGSGYLRLDGSLLSVAYKFMLNHENFTGGGFLLGLGDEDSLKAAEIGAVELSVSPNKYLSLVVGRYDGDWLPAAVLGLTVIHDDQAK
jgi:hypothetical protein